MFDSNFVKSILKVKAVQRESCNYRGLQAVPRIDHMVTEEVVCLLLCDSTSTSF